MSAVVRKIRPEDETRWRELWDGYTRFYEREPDGAITRRTWAQILDPKTQLQAIVAEAEDSGVIGMANYLIHENTNTLNPICYLADFFVDPSHRRSGAGKLMIDWLVKEMKTQHWARIYWHTKENNYRARALYDKYGPHSGFLRHVIQNPENETP